MTSEVSYVKLPIADVRERQLGVNTGASLR